MAKRQRIVWRTPLEELWDSGGPVPATAGRPLGATEISDLLRTGPVSFVRANVGEPLRWIPESEGFDFWKREVKPHLVPPDKVEEISLDDFEEGYCYLATEWTRSDKPPVVLLLMVH